MRKTCAFLIFVFLTTSLNYSQGRNRMELPENCLYFEALGSGITWSVNYDRLVLSEELLKINGRFGYTLASSSYVDGSIHGFHLESNVMLGRRTQFFETGPGFSYWLPGESSSSYVMSYRIGYRAYILNSYGTGMLFRIGFIPLYQIQGSLNFEFLPFGGAAIGAVF